jgi:hypothetical protein
VLHGRGRWGDALKHFAATVTAHSVWDAIDCVYGAGLSLNVLGETEVLHGPILKHHHSQIPEIRFVSMTKTRTRLRKDWHPRRACSRVSHHFGRGCVPEPPNPKPQTPNPKPQTSRVSGHFGSPRGSNSSIQMEARPLPRTASHAARRPLPRKPRSPTLPAGPFELQQISSTTLSAVHPVDSNRISFIRGQSYLSTPSCWTTL